ncbi:DUF2254 domain-containing protein [Conexibacter sp. JD483]|uniref:DUF2254 domain-containing protein n=1 Tax=unclassified Conexibacter TaxID=2627773 RepID=UPI00271A57FF|nr:MULTISPECIES: DUF2254 domain-containing protein [unclassified Conexibacter]MDO8189297.1 DUF2254 domain-containing protein [Conexibacter sp. CPCC 205706]MDO8201753.1 DUF2254 domain-containing protein [Conexibacter sp. CPCC 205762]MDR9372357.1 DUF2254 domain-containing protein [Conexibacter sp. JD483]
MAADGDTPQPPRQQLSARERSRAWRLRFRLRETSARSLVLLPCLYIVAALLLGWGVPRLEGERDLLGLDLDPDTARTFLSSLASGMIAFAGLVVSIAVVVVTFGASQYTPRLLAVFRRDPVVKHALGVFVAPTICALVSLRDIGRDGATTVPSLTLGINLLLLIAALLAFFALVSRLIDLLRPRRVIAQVVARAGAAIAETYPFPLADGPPLPLRPLAPPGALVRHEGTAGVLSALDRGRAVRAAQAAGVVAELAVGIGGFVPRGAVLFRVHGDAAGLDAAELRRAALLADERTIGQDPAFALRAIVDVALRALSPAVNDPTTAVQALDGLEELLRELSTRDLERGQLADAAGELRLVVPNPGWEALLDLAVTEIRVYGAEQPQVMRRMRSLLLSLREQSPPVRAAALDAQLARLDAVLERAYPDPVERSHAAQADHIGIGGEGTSAPD